MSRDKAPVPVPAERSRTVRQQIIECLSGAPVSAAELSAEVGLPEKQVHEELDSLRRQVRLVVTPPRCGKCGFEFPGRRRVRKPGKCPRCRGTFIEEPLFSVPGAGQPAR